MRKVMFLIALIILCVSSIIWMNESQKQIVITIIAAYILIDSIYELLTRKRW